jgi:hypothetical protein
MPAMWQASIGPSSLEKVAAALFRIEFRNRPAKGLALAGCRVTGPDHQKLFLGPERLQSIHHEPAHQPELIAVGGK